MIYDKTHTLKKMIIVKMMKSMLKIEIRKSHHLLFAVSLGGGGDVVSPLVMPGLAVTEECRAIL